MADAKYLVVPANCRIASCASLRRYAPDWRMGKPCSRNQAVKPALELVPRSLRVSRKASQDASAAWPLVQSGAGAKPISSAIWIAHCTTG